MIQEPQSQNQNQTHLIELPTVSRDSMSNSPPKTSTKLKITPTTNPLNRSTNIQIPKQNSKPRIFLLTRPAKLPLVRIDTPVQAHQNQKDLNYLPHHPQPKEKNNLNVTVLPSTKIVRIPFLTRSQTKTPSSVKSQAIYEVPRKDLAIQYQPLKDLNQITVPVAPQRSQSELKSKDSLIIHQEIIQAPKTQAIIPQLSPAIASSGNQYQVLTKSSESVKKTIKTTTTIQENTVNLAKKKQKTINTSLMQLTLASMAGIELTGADMSHTAADMSGAMPPTATVEEINVPVFIDEYLQQAAISTTAATTASVTTQNINYDNNNNNNSSSISNNNPSNGKGNDEVNTSCLVDTTFDNFEFDIELLTENNSKDQDKPRLRHPHHQQQQQMQLVVDDIQQPQNNLEDNSIDEEEEDHDKQQLQLMLEEIFNNNNNQNQSCCNTNNSNHSLLNNSTTNNNNNINKMDFNMSEDCFNIDEEALFNVAPTSQNLDITYDMIDLPNFSPTLENAVDFNQLDNDGLSLMSLGMTDEASSYYIDPDVMLHGEVLPTSSSVASTNPLKSYPTAAVALSQEILKAEPHVSPDHIHYQNSSFSLTSATTPAPSPSLSQQSDLNVCHDRSDLLEDLINVMLECPETKVNFLKRNSSAQTKKHMEEKRSKLRLDTKRRNEVAPQHLELDTPSIINTILQHEESMSNMSPAETSMEIYNKLINSPHESIIKSEIDVGDYIDSISPPYTPYSVTSTSNQTNFTGIINTAPSSPASSVSTTNVSSAATRRGRGRPAKLHSDMPDLSTLNHLPESEQKKLLERAKNNEASRKSRLKNKERDVAIEREERELSLHNQQLHMDLQDIKKIERKLRQALKRQHFTGTPY